MGLYPSSLTLLHGTGLGFTLSHFPVLSGGVGVVGSCATSSLNGSLSSKSSWLLTFFNSNLIGLSSPCLCYMVLSLSPFFPYLYYMVSSFIPFWVESLYPYSYPYYMVLFLSPFWVESLYCPPYPYYMVLSLSPFWVESLCSYPYVYTIVTFL